MEIPMKIINQNLLRLTDFHRKVHVQHILKQRWAGAHTDVVHNQYQARDTNESIFVHNVCFCDLTRNLLPKSQVYFKKANDFKILLHFSDS